MAKVDRESRKNRHQMENTEERHLRALVLIGRRGREPGQAIAFGTALSVSGRCRTGVRRCQMPGGKRESHYAVALHPAAHGCLGRPGGLYSTKLEVLPEMLQGWRRKIKGPFGSDQTQGNPRKQAPTKQKTSQNKKPHKPTKKGHHERKQALRICHSTKSPSQVRTSPFLYVPSPLSPTSLGSEMSLLGGREGEHGERSRLGPLTFPTCPVLDWNSPI